MPNLTEGSRRILPFLPEKIFFWSLRRPVQPHAPRLNLASSIKFTLPSAAPKIESVDPRALIVEKLRENEAAVQASLLSPLKKAAVKKLSWLNNSTFSKVALAATAFLTVSLIPKTLLAATGVAAALSNPLGIAVLAGIGIGSLIFYTRYLYGFDKAMDVRNGNPGDPTLWRQIKNFSIIPLSILTGSTLLYYATSLLPFGATPAFLTLAGASLVYGLCKMGISIYRSIKANSQTVSETYRSKLRNILGTNFLSYGVQGSEAAYMLYRGATLGTLFVNIFAHMSYAIQAGLVSFGSMGVGGLIGAGIGLTLVTQYRDFVAKKRNPLGHEYGPRFTFRSMLGTAAATAALGSLVAGFGPSLLVNAVLALAFFFAESHAMVHNWSCQGGSREIIKQRPEEFPDREVWHAARRPDSPWITVMKPGFVPIEFLRPTYALLYLRKGVNWDFNVISGINLNDPGFFKETYRTLKFLRDKQEDILKIVAGHQTMINTPGVTMGQKYDLLAKMYEDLAAHWQVAAKGDLSPLDPKKKDFFIQPDAEEADAYLHQAILWEGKKFQALATELRARSHRTFKEVDEHLEALVRQYSVIFHWFPPKMFRNFCPDQIKSKIREVDLFNQLTRDFKTGASILRRNRQTEELYWEILPCKRIRSLDTHTKTLAWIDRTPGEIKDIESYSDIRYVDNRKMADPTGPVHSREAYTYQDMKTGESLSIVYKNGTVETFRADGTITTAGKPRDPNVDDVVWVPGMPLPAELKGKLPKPWLGKGDADEVFKPSLFHFFGSKYQTMCDGEHADISTSDFLAPLEKDIKDPYLFALFTAPEEIDLPWDPKLKETASDKLVRLSSSYANFMLKVKETAAAGGKTLFIPYNWMKNTKIHKTIWTNIHHIELMTREEFRRRFSQGSFVAEARDNHGDKSPNIIVAFDENNNRLRVFARGKKPISKYIYNKAVQLGYVKEVDNGLGLAQPGLDAALGAGDLRITFSGSELQAATEATIKGTIKDMMGKILIGKDPSQINTEVEDCPELLNKLVNETIAAVAAAGKEDLKENFDKVDFFETLEGIVGSIRGKVSEEEFRTLQDTVDQEGLKETKDSLTKSAIGEVLPYSYFLKDPAAYEKTETEIDTGLGRIGDMNLVAYTFRRADGTRYMRWLPKDGADWPEMDFREEIEAHFNPRGLETNITGRSITLKTCRWIGKRFFYDRFRLAANPGSHEEPNFVVKKIEGPKEFLDSIGAKKPRVVAVTERDANGKIARTVYRQFNGRGVNLDNVVEQTVNGTNLILSHIIKEEDNRVVPLDITLQHPSAWVSSVRLAPNTADNKLVQLTVSFKNPFSGAALDDQVIPLARGLFPSLDSIYQGSNLEYAPKLFDQRQKDRRASRERAEVVVETRLFLDLHTSKRTTVAHGLTLAGGEEVKLIDVKSSLRVVHNNDNNGKRQGEEEWLPFDQALPKASRSEVWFDEKEENRPFTSGLSFGKLDTMIAPQHLVPIRFSPTGLRGLVEGAKDVIPGLRGEGLGGAEWATDDQKFFFGEPYDESGEYNWPYGWVKDTKRPWSWSTGPFSLQYAKSIRGAALNTGSNTVMRSPHEDLLFSQEELEVYAKWNGRNYMPVPLKKSLFNKTTTTEDAQGAMEKKTMFGLETHMDRTVRSIGASVPDIGSGAGQRGRWAAMLIFLQRVGKLFTDELIRARLLKQIPSQYTNAQLHEWFNTFTWYLDTYSKHVIVAIPFAYMLGLSPLPAGAIVFPILWLVKTMFGWPKYAYDNQKVGVSRFRSYFRNLALYFLYAPNVARNTSHIDDEAKGPFVSTAGIGGQTFFPWAIRRITYYFGGMSALTTTIGVARMLAFGLTPFGLAMNVIFPAILTASVGYALKLAWNEMSYKFENSDLSDPRSYANAFKNKRGVPSKWVMFQKEFWEPLTFKDTRNWLKQTWAGRALGAVTSRMGKWTRRIAFAGMIGIAAAGGGDTAVNHLQTRPSAGVTGITDSPPKNESEKARKKRVAIEKISAQIADLENYFDDVGGLIQKGDPHYNNKVRIDLARKYQELYFVTQDIKYRQKALATLQAALGEADPTLIWEYDRPFIREYFEILLQQAELASLESNPDALKIIQRVYRELANPQARNAYQVRDESEPGYHNRARLIEGRALENHGDLAGALTRYHDVLNWADGELSKNDLFLWWEGKGAFVLPSTTRSDIGFIRASAQIRLSFIALAQGHPSEVFNYAGPVIREPAAGDLRFDALIVTMQACLEKHGNNLAAARGEFLKLVKDGQVPLTADLLSALGLSENDLARPTVNLWALILGGLDHTVLSFDSQAQLRKVQIISEIDAGK